MRSRQSSNRGRRRWATRFGILTAGVLVFAASGLAMSAPSGAGARSVAHTAASGPTTASIVPCPSSDPSTDTCANMPCPTDTNCGQIVAGPTQNIGEGQYVYLSLSDFAPGNLVLVNYCSDPGGTGALPTQPTSGPGTVLNCATSDTNYTAPSSSGISIFPAAGSLQAGTAETSVQTEEESPPGIALDGTPNPIYCDNTLANSCVIVLTEPALAQGNNGKYSDNSVAIPLSFATTSGCPAAASVNAEGEYGIDALVPTLTRLTCTGSNPVIPVETAVGGLEAVQQLAAGGTEMAFTDDPESPDQQKALTSGSFALIPVALTANVVGVDAQVRGTGLDNTVAGVNYPINQMELTPTMAAGLVMNYSSWQASYEVDDQDACSGPSESGGVCGGPPCGVLGTSATCSLFDQLNYLPGFNNFFRSGGVMYEGTSGATDEFLTWLCDAPKAPLDFGTKPLESESGSQTLIASLGESKATCPAGQDSVPAFDAPSDFFLKENPAAENLEGPTFVENESGASAAAAFIPENWAEAEYYGVGAVAALQNAAGSFVLPTPASLDAALTDAEANGTNPDGSITPDYATTDPAAYPMPDVIYAAVSTKPVPATQASNETNLLTQMLALTGTGGANVGQLPPGFAPLPSNLVSEAQSDITKDIVAEPAPPTSPSQGGGGGGGGGGTTGSTTTPSSSSGYIAPTGLLYGAPSSSFPFVAGITPLASAAANSLPKPSSHGPTGPLLGPALPAYALAANQGNTVVTLAWILGLIALLAGLVLMSTSMLTKIRSARGPAPTGEDGGAELPAAGAAPA
jgi:hypothetical protein